MVSPHHHQTYHLLVLKLKGLRLIFTYFTIISLSISLGTFSTFNYYVCSIHFSSSFSRKKNSRGDFSKYMHLVNFYILFSFVAFGGGGCMRWIEYLVKKSNVLLNYNNDHFLHHFSWKLWLWRKIFIWKMPTQTNNTYIFTTDRYITLFAIKFFS